MARRYFIETNATGTVLTVLKKNYKLRATVERSAVNRRQSEGKGVAWLLRSRSSSISISAAPTPIWPSLCCPQIEQRTGVKFDYVPVLLGGVYKATGNMSPAKSLRGIKNKPEYNALETERFLRRHNITKFKSNPFFPVNTLMLMRGVVAAEFEGMFEPYFRAAYHHMWVEPKKMDDPQVFREAFLSSGTRHRPHHRPRAAGRRQEEADREHRQRGRARRVRLADVLRRRRDLLRQGQPARRRGRDRRAAVSGAARKTA